MFESELLPMVEPFLGVIQEVGQGIVPMLQVPQTLPVGGTSSVMLLESQITQDDLFRTVELNEDKVWKDLISSKEWRFTERHFHFCEQKIQRIIDKALDMYGEGTLKSGIEGKERDLRDLNIEESDIRIGIEAYLSDLHSFLSNASRLGHLKSVLACIGKTKSPIWQAITNLIIRFQSN